MASIVIDPNTFSKDGTISLSGIYFSNDNRYLGYATSNSGSDWKEFHIKDLKNNKVLNDNLKWIKFSGMSWVEDGFYYSTFQSRFKVKSTPKVMKEVRSFITNLALSKVKTG